MRNVNKIEIETFSFRLRKAYLYDVLSATINVYANKNNNNNKFCHLSRYLVRDLYIIYIYETNNRNE